MGNWINLLLETRPMARNTARMPPITTEEISNHKVIATPVKR
ncbi:hypothetical protein UUU_29950 [Klebsiella pneumoniae subsp. pneumoniae DSM 30104 = JCM 1662 = NBRC 14940]|nr:hypothetical protein UUU_29950 [Klebsiella pneumoniae subsp. pneumoniae DSM 30104 = JCM 1662 = NBRC 14940]